MSVTERVSQFLHYPEPRRMSCELTFEFGETWAGHWQTPSVRVPTPESVAAEVDDQFTREVLLTMLDLCEAHNSYDATDRSPAMMVAYDIDPERQTAACIIMQLLDRPRYMYRPLKIIDKYKAGYFVWRWEPGVSEINGRPWVLCGVDKSKQQDPAKIMPPDDYIVTREVGKTRHHVCQIIFPDVKALPGAARVTHFQGYTRVV